MCRKGGEGAPWSVREEVGSFVKEKCEEELCNEAEETDLCG